MAINTRSQQTPLQMLAHRKEIATRKSQRYSYATKEKAPELLLLGTMFTDQVMTDDGEVFDMTCVEIEDQVYIVKQERQDPWYDRPSGYGDSLFAGMDKTFDGARTLDW